MTEIRHANDHRSPSAEAALSGEHGSRVESIFIYNEKDVQDAKHFAADASKLLGKLEIDHKPGISRAEILTSAEKKNVSEQYSKIYAGLSNIEPNVQTAWQVPDHRHHLKESLSTDPKVRANAKAKLAEDRKKQTEIYFNQGAVTPAKLAELKQQIGRVEVAVGALHDVNKTAAHLLKQFGKEGQLTPAAVQNILKNGHLSPSDKLLLNAVATSQNQTKADMQLDVWPHKQPSPQALEQGATLDAKKLAVVVAKWGIGETRGDGKNKEPLFFNAIEGYDLRGIGIKSQHRFDSEMAGKDGSQLNDYTRPPSEY